MDAETSWKLAKLINSDFFYGENSPMERKLGLVKLQRELSEVDTLEEISPESRKLLQQAEEANHA